jgi:NADH-quinone oxidoreductase subunit N
MLIGVAGFSIFSFSSSLFYMVYYIIMSIAMFIILLTIYPRTHNAIFELTGLSRINPILAITLALLLLSMAGVPPMVGFYNKYLIIIEAIQSSL